MNRKRKFLLLLPLLTLPFLVLLFIILGGGKGSGDTMPPKTNSGLNTKLPDAHFKKGSDKSKLALYDEASRDSSMIRERIKNDPYYLLEQQIRSSDSAGAAEHKNSSGFSVPDENTSRIMEKLNKLKSVIREKTDKPSEDPRLLYHTNSSSTPGALEQLMPDTRPEKNHDPRMDQITTMLDKVMAIQHPEILQDSMDRLAKSHEAPSYRVVADKGDSDPQIFGGVQSNEVQIENMNRFYGPAGEGSIEKDIDNILEAVIPETQSLVSGSTIKLSLVNDVRINGHFIAKNQLIYGTTILSGERLKIQFSSIRSGQNILPVSMEAYDMDGLAGIYIPGSINRDVAKQSTDQATGSIGINSLDPSIGAQAAGAGIQAAKTLLSRKVKLVKVTVKAGYKIFLKDTHL